MIEILHVYWKQYNKLFLAMVGEAKMRIGLFIIDRVGLYIQDGRFRIIFYQINGKSPKLIEIISEYKKEVEHLLIDALLSELPEEYKKDLADEIKDHESNKNYFRCGAHGAKAASIQQSWKVGEGL